VIAAAIVVPPGWRPMWELPLPGRARRFIYDTPAGPLRSDLPRYPWGGETLSPIGWRYA
jgi:hypothetical protein